MPKLSRPLIPFDHDNDHYSALIKRFENNDMNKGTQILLSCQRIKCGSSTRRQQHMDIQHHSGTWIKRIKVEILQDPDNQNGTNHYGNTATHANTPFWPEQYHCDELKKNTLHVSKRFSELVHQMPCYTGTRNQQTVHKQSNKQ